MITSAKLPQFLFAIALSASVSGVAADRQPIKDKTIFNGKDLTGWSASEMKYWSVKDGAIVGHSAVNVPKNEFIWADGKVQDFYLTVDVKLTPDNRNAGIQFRSKEANALAKKYGISGIPALVIVSAEGEIITKNGRGDVSSNPNGALASWQKP